MAVSGQEGGVVGLLLRLLLVVVATVGMLEAVVGAGGWVIFVVFMLLVLHFGKGFDGVEGTCENGEDVVSQGKGSDVLVAGVTKVVGGVARGRLDGIGEDGRGGGRRRREKLHWIYLAREKLEQLSGHLRCWTTEAKRKRTNDKWKREEVWKREA